MEPMSVYWVIVDVGEVERNENLLERERERERIEVLSMRGRDRE